MISVVTYMFIHYIYCQWSVNIYIYIHQMDCVNVTTKSAQHAHARMIAIIVVYIWLEFGLFQQLYMYIYVYTFEYKCSYVYLYISTCNNYRCTRWDQLLVIFGPENFIWNNICNSKNMLRGCKFDIGHNIAEISNPSFNLSQHNLKK